MRSLPSFVRTRTLTPSSSCSRPTASLEYSRRDPGGLGAPAQDGLESDLRDEQPRRRAEVLDALVDRTEVPVELLPAQRFDRHDRAVLDELGGSRLLDLALQAERAVLLDGPLAYERRPGMDRGSGMSLDDERGHSLGPQEHGGREADQAPADDHDRDFVVRHSCRSLARRAHIGAPDDSTSWTAPST